MADSIPGPITFIVGIIISITSFFINKKSFAFNGAYSLFLYVGLILTFYGFVKIMIWYMNRKSKEEQINEQKKDMVTGGANQYQQGLNNQVSQNQNYPAQNQQGQNQVRSFQNQNFEPSPMMENQLTSGKGQDNDRYNFVIKCRNCGLTHYAAYANFCQNCGTRLR